MVLIQTVERSFLQFRFVFFLSEPVAFRRVYGLESCSRTSEESNHHRHGSRLATQECRDTNCSTRTTDLTQQLCRLCPWCVVLIENEPEASQEMPHYETRFHFQFGSSRRKFTVHNIATLLDLEWVDATPPMSMKNEALESCTPVPWIPLDATSRISREDVE